MDLEIYKLLGTKIKSLLKIVNAEYELNNINKLVVLDDFTILSDGNIKVYIDYENDNGVYSVVVIFDKEQIASLDSLYKALSNI